MSATDAPERVLDVTDLSAGYNGLPVVRDLTLHVDTGEVVALLGSNGAGKTTTLSAIAGLIAPLDGQITFVGASTKGKSAQRLAREGLSLVPEDRALFHELTARENLRVAGARRGFADREAQVLDLLPSLKPCLERKAGMLSGGEQQMLAIGRALVGSPRLLIVDEMSLGLAPVIVDRLLPVLRDIATTFGAGVLIVEQHVARAMDVAGRAYVLAHGRLVLQGDTADLRSRTSLIAASYFGDLDAVAQLTGEPPVSPEDAPPTAPKE